MKYPDLIEIVQSTIGEGTTKKLAEDVLNNIFGAITGAVLDGEEVTISKFGRFYSSVRAPRTARNPRTGEAIDVPAKIVTKFTPRGVLKAQ